MVCYPFARRRLGSAAGRIADRARLLGLCAACAADKPPQRQNAIGSGSPARCCLPIDHAAGRDCALHCRNCVMRCVRSAKERCKRQARIFDGRERAAVYSRSLSGASAGIGQWGACVSPAAQKHARYIDLRSRKHRTSRAICREPHAASSADCS